MSEKIINVKGIDYIVSDDGKIYSTNNRGRAKYHQEIKQRKNQDGYMVVTVGKKNNRTSIGVHRMVALAFLPNPDNLPEVNHKDFNRENNRVDNLEWCTHIENIQYTINAGRHNSTTQDYSGCNNPNYGNHILSKKYADNPDYAKQCQSRPGTQNGRATKIYLYNSNYEFLMEFPYIQLCAVYVAEKLNLKPSIVPSLAARITRYANDNHLYKNTFYFSKDNTVPSLNKEGATTIENIT